MGPATQIMPQCAASVHSLDVGFVLSCPGSLQNPNGNRTLSATTKTSFWTLRSVCDFPRLSMCFRESQQAIKAMVRQSFAMIFGSFLKPPFVTGCFPTDHVQSDSKAMRFRRQPPTEALWSMDPWMRRSLCQLGFEQHVSLNISWIVNVYSIHLGQQKHVGYGQLLHKRYYFESCKDIRP